MLTNDYYYQIVCMQSSGPVSEDIYILNPRTYDAVS